MGNDYQVKIFLYSQKYMQAGTIKLGLALVEKLL